MRWRPAPEPQSLKGLACAEPNEESAHGQHRHAILLECGEQVRRTFEVVVATDERVGAPVEGGLDHEIVIWVATQANRARHVHVLATVAEQRE